jgi:hypothetical protein
MMTTHMERNLEEQFVDDPGLVGDDLRRNIIRNGLREAIPTLYGIETLWGSQVDALLDMEDFRLFTVRDAI